MKLSHLEVEEEGHSLEEGLDSVLVVHMGTEHKSSKADVAKMSADEEVETPGRRCSGYTTLAYSCEAAAHTCSC